MGLNKRPSGGAQLSFLKDSGTGKKMNLVDFYENSVFSRQLLYFRYA